MTRFSHATSAATCSLSLLLLLLLPLVLASLLFGSLPFPCLSSRGFWYLVSGGFEVASSSIWLRFCFRLVPRRTGKGECKKKREKISK